MTETGYLVWLIAMAITIMTVLTVGTLYVAELLPHQRRAEKRPTDEEPDAGKGSS